MANKIKPSKLNLLSPFLNIAHKVVDSSLWGELLSIKIIRSAAASHANQIDEYYLEFLSEIRQQFEVESSRGCIPVDENKLGK